MRVRFLFSVIFRMNAKRNQKYFFRCWGRHTPSFQHRLDNNCFDLIGGFFWKRLGEKASVDQFIKNVYI